MRTSVGVLATVALGLAAGAVLTEAAVLVPWWRTLDAPAFFAWYAANTDRLFAFFGTLETTALVLALAAAALHRTRWFVGAAVLAVAVLVPFPLYFAKVNAAFAAGTIPADRLADELARWAAWHGVRTTLAIGAFVAATAGCAAARRPPTS